MAQLVVAVVYSLLYDTKSAFSMRREIPAVIFGPARAFRDALERNLRPAGFHVVASKETLTEVSRGELPRSGPCLIVIECGESLGPHTAQIAELKQQNPLAGIMVVGQRWTR
jgi:hypothetical protein